MNRGFDTRAFSGLIAIYAASTAACLGTMFLMPAIIDTNIDLGPHIVMIIIVITVLATFFAVHKASRTLKHYALIDVSIAVAYFVAFHISSNNGVGDVFSLPLAAVIYFLHLCLQAAVIHILHHSAKS